VKLRRDHYYVGTTANPDRRFAEHIEGAGAAWTTLYMPVSMVECVPVPVGTLPGIAEDTKVLELMEKYGIDAVRGGTHSAVDLTEEVRHVLRSSMWHARNACLRCGHRSHWAADCTARNTIDGDHIVDPSWSESSESETDSDASSYGGYE
jgi:hypothetical protein